MAHFTASLQEGRKASLFTGRDEGPQCPPYWAIVKGGAVVLRTDDDGLPLTRESAAPAQ